MIQTHDGATKAEQENNPDLKTAVFPFRSQSIHVGQSKVYQYNIVVSGRLHRDCTGLAHERPDGATMGPKLETSSFLLPRFPDPVDRNDYGCDEKH